MFKDYHLETAPRASCDPELLGCHPLTSDRRDSSYPLAVLRETVCCLRQVMESAEIPHVHAASPAIRIHRWGVDDAHVG